MNVAVEGVDIATTHAARHAHSDDRRAVRVLLLTAGLQALAFALHRHSQVAAVAFQALVSVRVFIIFHDTVHHSFFSRPRWNRALGTVLSAWTITPWQEWRDMHLHHHAHSGDLGVFDQADTIQFTRRQYESLAPLPRAVVRVLRDPLVFFPLVSLLQWWVLYPIGAARRLDWPVLAGHALHVAAAACVGRGHLLGLFFGSIVGTGLFHLQHACNPCYRAQSLAYNPIAASLRGSTMLKVPPPLRWATLGIEYHHLHHLNTKIPGYALRECHDTAPNGAWQAVTCVGYLEGARAMLHVMYDERTQKMVTF